MNTKPAAQSTTILSAVAAILGIVASLVIAYDQGGFELLLPLAFAEGAGLLGQFRIISERIKGNPKQIKGLF
mgnify:CR=1 FL=1